MIKLIHQQMNRNQMNRNRTSKLHRGNTVSWIIAMGQIPRYIHRMQKESTMQVTHTHTNTHIQTHTHTHTHTHTLMQDEAVVELGLSLLEECPDSGGTYLGNLNMAHQYW
jgi:hypothetical protein